MNINDLLHDKIHSYQIKTGQKPTTISMDAKSWENLIYEYSSYLFRDYFNKERKYAGLDVRINKAKKKYILVFGDEKRKYVGYKRRVIGTDERGNNLIVCEKSR